MSDFLARQIQITLDAGNSALSIEKRAGVPGTAIHSILRGTRPRPERLAELLTAVDRETAARWLRAYLLDDVPEDWRDNVSITIDPDATKVAESPVTATTAADQFLIALEWLRSEGEHDLEIVSFITDLVALLRRDTKK